MNRAAEIGTEVGIAVTFVIGLVVLAVYVPESQWPDKKWVGAALGTVTVFGYFVYWNKHLLRNGRFWGFFAAAFGLHCVLWTAVLLHIETMPLVWFSFASIGEVAVICATHERVLRRS